MVVERPDETDLVKPRASTCNQASSQMQACLAATDTDFGGKTVHGNKRIMLKLPDISAASLIPASIEASPAQVLGPASLAGIFPRGVRVYLTDTGAASQEKLVDAATHLRNLGYEPVPHLAARRIPSRVEFEEQVKRLAGEADVTDVLVVGGGVDRPAGPFASSMDMLSSGIFDRYGIKRSQSPAIPKAAPISARRRRSLP